MIFTNNDEALQIIIINTNAENDLENEYINKINKYENGIVLLKDKLIYKNNILSQNIEYSYENILNFYDIQEFEKQDVLNFVNSINGIGLYSGFVLFIGMYMFVIYFISTLIDAFMLAILGFVLARIIGVKIKFKATFNIGVYALTLPIILNLIYIVINAFTGFTIRYFQWMYTTISYIYVIVSILIIKTDLINRQMELMKIIEEQEKVKKELEEKERQEKEKREREEHKENNDDDEKTKQKKKKDKEDNGIEDSGLAPQE
ncbi:MAG: DUF1189 family protein [Clostridia bacterium]|nr:DUF1189 family protein [Clostridia bacterium]